MFDAKLLIGGESVDAVSGATFDRTDPVTSKPATRAAAGGIEDARKAIEAAKAALPAWSAVGPNARRQILIAAANKVREKAPQFA
jgi:acyl-CoA reductase-like NAD-dependent aldehyde dehydrogenase